MKFSKLYTFNKQVNNNTEICITNYQCYLSDINFYTHKNISHLEFNRVKNLYFDALVCALNQMHNTKFGDRYWRILLGHWYERFCNVMVNRYGNISLLLNKYPIKNIESVSVSKEKFTPVDTSDSYVKFTSQSWNSEFYALIASSMSPALNFTYVLADPNREIKLKNNKITLKQKILKIYTLISSYLVKKDDVFIISSFLRFFDECLLQIFLGQIPQFWRTPSMKIKETPDINSRKIFEGYLNLQIPNNDSFGRIFSIMLAKSIPVVFLEGYKLCSIKAKSNNFPKYPKIIFTSNNFDADDFFKFWLVDRLQNPNCKYIVGQHGNNYFTNKYTGLTVEESTADKFITWGSAAIGDNYINGFNFKLSGKSVKYSKYGRLLWVADSRGLLDKAWNVEYEYDLYFQNQILFFSLLNIKILEKVTARLHSSYKLWGYKEDEKLSRIYPEITFNLGIGPITKLYGESRLILHSYDSTGLLECLTLNIPCVAFWSGEYDHIDEKYRHHYEALREVGIIHFSAESTATHINLIWNDIDSWWLSSKVQKAREIFCEHFSRPSLRPIKDMKTFLSYSASRL